MEMNAQRNTMPQKDAADGERGMRSRKQRGWRSTLPLLLLLLIGTLFMGGCGSGGGDQVLSTVTGLVSTFEGYASGGKVELRTLHGEPLTGGSGEVLSTGLFEIMPPDPLPASFLVVVTEATEMSDNKEPGSADVPPTLQALVKNDGNDILDTRVTPLSSLVAQYALSTGKNLEESDAAIAAFLDLEPGVSPSRLAPPLVDTSDFGFNVFGASWMASGLSFNAFLDGLVENSLSGETKVFANEEGEDQCFISIFKWILEKVAAAAVGKGVGSISSLITGNGEWNAVQKQMAEISQSLDKIYNELVTFENDVKKMLKQILVEADYNVIIDPISDISSHYDDLQRLAKYKDRERAKVLAAQLDNAFHEHVKNKLDIINVKLANPIVGTTFYQKLAGYLLELVTSGEMTGDRALLTYKRVFIYLTGIQIQGLILCSEHAHLSTNPEDVKRETLEYRNKHIERITAQAKCFLDGAEKIVVFGFPHAGCTLDYHKGKIMPEDGGSPYLPIDNIAADAVGVGMQIVTRLVWDPLVPTQYPWADNPPLDYEKYFPFLKERMAKLAVGKTTSLFLVSLERKTRIEAVVKNGTVNSMTYRIPGEKRMHAVVLRHMFRDLPNSNETWILTVTSDAEKTFDLSEEEANRFPGTVGRKLLNSSESNDEKAESIRFCFFGNGHTEPVNSTVSLFAWLPDQFLLRNGTPVVQKLHANNKDDPYRFKCAVRSRFFDFVKLEKTKKMILTFLPHLRVNEDSATTQALTRYEPSTSDAYLRYGDVVTLNGLVRDTPDTSQFWARLFSQTRLPEINVAYQPTGHHDEPGEYNILVLESLPFVTGTFMNPKKISVYPRAGYPVLLKLRSTGNFLQEIDSGQKLLFLENKKINGVFWSFYPKD